MIPSTSSRTLAIRQECLPKCAARSPKPDKYRYDKHTEHNHRQKILNIYNDKYINVILHNLILQRCTLQNSPIVKLYIYHLFSMNKSI